MGYAGHTAPAPDPDQARSRAAEYLTTKARSGASLPTLAQHAGRADWAETTTMTPGDLRTYLGRILDAVTTSTLTASWADGASISTQPAPGPAPAELISPETIRLLQSHADYLDARADAWSRYNPPISAETTQRAAELETLVEVAHLLNSDAGLRADLDAARARRADRQHRAAADIQDMTEAMAAPGPCVECGEPGDGGRYGDGWLCQPHAGINLMPAADDESGI